MTEVEQPTDFSGLAGNDSGNGNKGYNATRTPDQASKAGTYIQGPALRTPFIQEFIPPRHFKRPI